MSKEIPHNLVGCGDCDPCIGGRPDQCAVGAITLIVAPKEMKRFVVAVLADGSNREKKWTVRASTAPDAIQLAFALDGGWGKEKDASDMFPLAQAYARVIQEFPQ